MSKIAEFTTHKYELARSTSRNALRECRDRLERMTRSPQKDGADSEVLRDLFKRLDRALEAL